MNSNATPDPPSGGLPRYDLFLLPFLVIATIAIMFLVSDTVAARHFQENVSDSCAVPDPVIVSRYKPNCVSHVKVAEGDVVENRFNACGLRSDAACGPKPANTTRIVLLGSSASLGAYVPVEEGFSTVAAQELSRSFGGAIEVQNMGRVACSPICTLHRLDEAFALHPDILMMTVSPHDLEILEPSDMANRYKPMSESGVVGAQSGWKSILARTQTALYGSHATFAIEHYLFQSPTTYLKVYLNYGEKAGYLRPQLQPSWQNHLSAFEIVLAEIADRAKSQGIPFVLVEVPSLAQAALAGQTKPMPNGDPYVLNNELAAICERHGTLFVDPLSGFKERPDTNKLFYVMDGHMNAAGNKIVGDAVAEKMKAAQIPALVDARARPRGTGN